MRTTLSLQTYSGESSLQLLVPISERLRLHIYFQLWNHIVGNAYERMSICKLVAWQLDLLELNARICSLRSRSQLHFIFLL